jgi:hypothetical protein
MKRTIAAVIGGVVLSVAAIVHAATTKVPDYSELWWNSSENGWGASVTLQDDIVFLVLYVYDAQRAPRFFVAPAMQLQSGTGPDNVFTGSLYRTVGSPATAPFDPSKYSPTQVGNASLRFTSPGTATLTYTIDGASVTKTITRQAYRIVDLSGSYRGGTYVNTNGCTAGAGLPSIQYTGTLGVTQSGTDVTIETFFDANFADGGHCILRGKLEQQGSLAAVVNGTYTCTFDQGSVPLSGTFEITDLESGENGFFGRYVGHEGGPACTHTGRIGGVRQGHP